MEKIKVSWTKDEFNAYILIYAAQTNFIETDEEKDFIESRIDKTIIDKIHKEIKKDNDYQKIQKIMAYVDQNQYGKDDLDKILSEIKDMYLCDGDFDSTEQAIYYSLKKIFNKN